MKILYVSQYFPPEMGAPSARVAELSHHWAEAGHDVTVLTGFPNHPTGVIAPNYRGKMKHLVMSERAGKVNVVRTWLLPFPNRKAYERMLNYSSFCLSSSITGSFVAQPDVVVATSPQLLVGLSGWWAARVRRVPFVFEVRDLWPESLSAVGMGDSNSLLHRGLSRVASFLYRRSSHIVVVTQAFEQHLRQHWNVPREKISVIENGVETDLFTPRAADVALRKALNAEGKFVVCYVGTMGMAHGLDTLLDVATRLQQRAPDVLFLLVGEGADKQRIVSLAHARGLDNLRFVDQQPREKIPAYICASDACLVMLKKTDLFKTVIPTKLLEFMACERPVVVGVDGEARKIIESAQAGLYVTPESVDEFATAIVRLKGDARLRETLARNGRRHIQEHFSRKRTADQYLSLLEGLLQVNSPVKQAA